MITKRVLSLGVLVGLAAVLGGCAPFQWAPDVSQSETSLTLDEKFAKIAQSVPSFGGLFFDSHQNLNIYLTDQMQIASAQSEIASVLGISVPQANVRVLKGEYNFVQLKRWHDRLVDLFEIEGVVLTDIDETQNRLKVGVERAELADFVAQELSKMGIPSQAVEIAVTEPVIPVVTLRDRVRPLQGGLQINFPGFLCTYGFNAVRSGVNGFVTNSHCTSTQGGVESTPYWQPTETIDPVQIGTEIADPKYNKNTCPRTLKGRKCRYSDSAFARHENSVAADFGFIEQTTGLGSITLSGNSYRIIAEAAASVGIQANKVGRTTGWSQGNVTATCVNVGVSGSSIVQLCQDQVSASVGSGDSGSPVFRIVNGNDVHLLGILWGGNTAGTSFTYSPIANIERTSTELGPVNTCASGFSC
jgi:hypothetical protein